MPAFHKILLYVTILCTFILLGKSLFYTYEYGGTDLRGRIIGARLIHTNYSPYFYKWDPEDGDYLLDPNTPTAIIANSNTVTPAVLYTIYPLATLPYKTIRLVWTLLQFCLLFLCFYLLSKSSDRNKPLFLSPVLITMLFIICSDLWLYYIERGQLYMLYVLFFSLMYWAYHKKWKYNHFVSGFIGGFFILYRPLAAVIGIGFLIQKKYNWILGSVTGFIVGCLLFVIPNPGYWKQYATAMKEYSYFISGHITSVSDYQRKELPARIEGTDNLTEYKNFTSGGMNTLHDYLDRVGINININQSILFYFLLILGLSLFSIKKKKIATSTDSIFLFGFLLYFLSEIFIVAPRAGYSVIQWVFPLFIAWKYILADRVLLFLYLAGILLYHQFPFLFPYQKDLAEFIFMLTIFFIIFPAVLEKLKSKINIHKTAAADTIEMKT